MDKFRAVSSKRGALGEGSYGVVSVTRHKDTGQLLAIKTAKIDISDEVQILQLIARIALNVVLY